MDCWRRTPCSRWCRHLYHWLVETTLHKITLIYQFNQMILRCRVSFLWSRKSAQNFPLCTAHTSKSVATLFINQDLPRKKSGNTFGITFNMLICSSVISAPFVQQLWIWQMHRPPCQQICAKWCAFREIMSFRCYFWLVSMTLVQVVQLFILYI